MAGQDAPLDPREERINLLTAGLEPYEVEFAYAYVRLGYNGRKAVESVDHYDVTTPNSAYVQASMLLRNSNIKELIGLIADRGFVEARISVTRILENLAARAFFDIRNYYDEYGNLRDLHDLTDEEAAAVDGLVNTIEGYTGKGDEKTPITRQELKMANKDRNLEMLGKYHKLFSDMMVDVKVSLADELVKARRRTQQNKTED